MHIIRVILKLHEITTYDTHTHTHTAHVL